MSNALTVADDARGAIDQLSAQIEPARASKELNFSSASRDELDSVRRDLRIAEANALAFLPRYAAIFKAEREQIGRRRSRFMSHGKSAASFWMASRNGKPDRSMQFRSCCRHGPTIIGLTTITSHSCQANWDRSRSLMDNSFFRFNAPSSAITWWRRRWRRPAGVSPNWKPT